MADVEGIIFDFGGVFTRSDETTERLSRYDELLGLPVGTLQSALYSGEQWELASTGRISPEAHWERTGKPYADRLPPDFARLQQGLFLCEAIDEAVVEVAQQLRRRYKMALCSNALNDLEAVLEQRPDIRQLFDVIVVSSAVGLRKPDPAILHLTADRLGLPSARCLLIDDKLRNTTAAVEAGLQAITFESAAQLKMALESRGILLPAV